MVLVHPIYHPYAACLCWFVWDNSSSVASLVTPPTVALRRMGWSVTWTWRVSKQQYWLHKFHYDSSTEPSSRIRTETFTMYYVSINHWYLKKISEITSNLKGWHHWELKHFSEWKQLRRRRRIRLKFYHKKKWKFLCRMKVIEQNLGCSIAIAFIYCVFS